MKRLFLFLIAAAGTTFFTSCEGPEGPPGPPGPTGYSAEAEVFEVNANFNAFNNYSQTYALTPHILPSDNILVYELYAVEQGIDAWALLPQVYYFPGFGQAQYNFNFSYDQFTLLIDADFDRNLLPASFVQNKIFRIVIIPGYFSARWGVDINDYNAVIRALNLEGEPIKQLN